MGSRCLEGVVLLPVELERLRDETAGAISSHFAESERVAILRFASGLDPRLTVDVSSRQPEFARYIQLHRMTGRVLSGLANEPSLTEAASVLSRRHDEFVRQYDEKMVVLARFVERYCSGMTVVLLKGPYAYFRSGDRSRIRRSSDIDLLVSAPNTLLARLDADGIPRKETIGPYIQHEFTDVTFEGVMFDLHRYVPVWNIGRGLRYSSSVKRFTGTRALLLDDRTDVGAVDVDHIHSMGLVLPLPGGQQVTVPDPALHALLMIHAAFRDAAEYFWSRNHKPPVRLIELCEMADTLSDRDFSIETFKDLAADLSSAEVLGWAGALLSTWLNDTRLLAWTAELWPRESVQQTARKRLGGAAWIALPRRPTEELIEAPSTAEMIFAMGDVAGPVTLPVEINLTDRSVGLAVVGLTSVEGLSLGAAIAGGFLELHVPVPYCIGDQEPYRLHLEFNNEVVELLGEVGRDDLILAGWTLIGFECFSRAEATRNKAVLYLDASTLPWRAGAMNVVASITSVQLPRDAERGWVAGIRLAQPQG